MRKLYVTMEMVGLRSEYIKSTFRATIDTYSRGE